MPWVIFCTAFISLLGACFLNWLSTQTRVQQTLKQARLFEAYADYGILLYLNRLQKFLVHDCRALKPILNSQGQPVYEVWGLENESFEKKAVLLAQLGSLELDYPEGQLRVWAEPLRTMGQDSYITHSLLTDNQSGGWMQDLSKILSKDFSSFQGRAIFELASPEGSLQGPLWDLLYHYSNNSAISLPSGFSKGTVSSLTAQSLIQLGEFPVLPSVIDWMKAVPGYLVEDLFSSRGDPVQSAISPIILEIGIDWHLQKEPMLADNGMSLIQFLLEAVPWVRVYNPHEDSLPEVNYQIRLDCRPWGSLALHRKESSGDWRAYGNTSLSTQQLFTQTLEAYFSESFLPGEEKVWRLGSFKLPTYPAFSYIFSGDNSLFRLEAQNHFGNFKDFAFGFSQNGSLFYPLDYRFTLRSALKEARNFDLKTLVDETVVLTSAVFLNEKPRSLLRRTAGALTSPVVFKDLRWHPYFPLQFLGESDCPQHLPQDQWISSTALTTKELLDFSYLFNQVFFDHYYGGEHPFVIDSHNIRQAFNVNETRPEAWEKFLEDLKENGMKIEAHDILPLAQSFAKQASLRKPFLSLSCWVNRQLEEGRLGQRGALAAALAEANVKLSPVEFLEAAGPRLRVRDDAWLIYAKFHSKGQSCITKLAVAERKEQGHDFEANKKYPGRRFYLLGRWKQ